jgi:site-specific DNA-adenine methylase
MIGIPYMGSKRKLANKIVDYILTHNPQTKYIYDVFGGGGAISFEFMQRKQIKQVYYNELNTAVCNLLKKIQKDGVTDEFYNWISREEFLELKDGTNWKSGLAQTCWSFGNNQKAYLFGKNIEEIKRQAHEFLLANGYLENPNKRIELINKFKQIAKIEGRFELQQLERLQQLEQLEQLERLEQLEQLERLEITNLDYQQVEFTTPKNETIIYLDPPYIDTAKYQKGLDYDQMYSWIDKLTKEGYKIYLSSYKSPLIEVEQYVHRSILSAKSNNRVCEKLFTNLPDENLKLL